MLDANVRFANDNQGFANHCPMALCALAGMGAQPARLQEFFDMWERRFAAAARPVVKPVSRDVNHDINREAWLACIGDANAFPALREYLEEWIWSAGADAVLEQVLSRIPFAPASVAFHALIRLSYGLEAQHVGEIAAGLAALVSGNLHIDMGPEQRPPAASVNQGWDILSRALGGAKFTGDWITTRVQAAVADPRFRATLPAAPPQPGLLDDMALAAIALYWQTNNFTALHIVTGLHAARRVLAHLPAALAQRLLPDLWIAVCAAYASIGAPPLAASNAMLNDDESLVDSADAWQDLFTTAIASDDDHVIKMVYTCYCENLRAPSPFYLAAAARRAGRVFQVH
ncbi:questin oxidase family protein [Collimonas silvisoli]|uniref:questin oxidase family protein n=1 Tax=Collimonas silvisoli TaxID=2825884 RepID=UPI001E5A2203|nr:questin oxidase family protein [Collimonas silvisoli]